MKRKPLTALLIILLFSGTVTIALGANKKRYAFRSTYTFENRGEEAYTLTEEDATMVLFANNEWQTVTLRNASHEAVREFTDEDGNRMAVMDLPPEIPAGATVVFSIEYVIESEDRAQPDIDPGEAGPLADIPTTLVEDFSSETETFTLNEDIETLAMELSENETTVLGIVTSMIDWITVNVEYCNFELPMYPNETHGDLQGDCDDQAILLISMLRSVGIPALLQIGVVFGDSISSEKDSWGGHLTIRQEGVGWHGWAMAYVPPWGWLPVDLTLTGHDDSLQVILNSPEYESYIVTAFNVSEQPYIGDSRRSRDNLMSSDIYVTVTDRVIKGSTDQGWLRILYIGAGVLAGGAFTVFIIVYNRRRRNLIDSY